jgi:hypothetical protein
MVADYRLVREALAIADGSSTATVSRAHVIALRDLLDTMRQAIAERAAFLDELLKSPRKL